MFNPVIVGAIVGQSLISKVSRIAGAILGYVITTGILLWGLSLYSHGDQIALFSIPLSQPIFLVSCLVWYGFDTKEYLNARKIMMAQESVQPTERVATAQDVRPSENPPE